MFLEVRENAFFTYDKGSLPAVLGACLKEEPYKSQVQWDKWHVWFVDERYVALDHAESNFKYPVSLFLY